MQARKTTVEAGPFRLILQEKLDELLDNYEITQAQETLAMKTKVSLRIIRRILNNEQQNISFDNADRIVTALRGPMAWYDDEALAAVYEGADLRAVDWAFPTSPKVEEGMRQLAKKLVAKHGTGQKAAASIGITYRSLLKFLPNGAVAERAADHLNIDTRTMARCLDESVAA